MIRRWLDSLSFTLAAAAGGVFMAVQGIREATGTFERQGSNASV